MQRLILSVSLFLVLSCESPSLPLISSIDYNIEWMSGSTRDILLFKDTLFEANESEGIIKLRQILKLISKKVFTAEKDESFRLVT